MVRKFRIATGMQRLNQLDPLGDPKDVACACAYLASDEAASVTSAILPIDGGQINGPLALLPEFAGSSDE